MTSEIVVPESRATSTTRPMLLTALAVALCIAPYGIKATPSGMTLAIQSADARGGGGGGPGAGPGTGPGEGAAAAGPGNAGPGNGGPTGPAANAGPGQGHGHGHGHGHGPGQGVAAAPNQAANQQPGQAPQSVDAPTHH